MIFVFDAMSYRHVFEGGQFPDEFPHLHRAARESFVFHRAYAPGNSTEISIPGIMCGVAGRMILRDNVPSFSLHSVPVPVRDLPSMFAEMKARGYRTVLVGAGAPWTEFFDEGLDYCESGEWGHLRLFGYGAWNTCRSVLLKQVCKRYGRFLPGLALYHRGLWRDSLIGMQDRIQESALREIHRSGRVLSVHHAMVPHWPYFYRRTGVLPLEETVIPYGSTHPDAYLRNLRYTDTLIGDLIDAMHASPDYDRTVYMITGDHAWRADPGISLPRDAGPQDYYAYCHVPLFIHLPGQESRVDVEGPFSTTALKALLLEYVDGPVDINEFAARVESRTRNDVSCTIDMSKVW
jgi:arylsulfatase A-like enzyme